MNYICLQNTITTRLILFNMKTYLLFNVKSLLILIILGLCSSCENIHKEKDGVNRVKSIIIKLTDRTTNKTSKQVIHYNYDKDSQLAKIDISNEIDNGYQDQHFICQWNNQTLLINNQTEPAKQVQYTFSEGHIFSQKDQSSSIMYSYEDMYLEHIQESENIYCNFMWNNRRVDSVTCKEGKTTTTIKYIYKNPTIYSHGAHLALRLDPLQMAYPEMFGLNTIEVPYAVDVQEMNEEDARNIHYSYGYEFDASGLISKMRINKTVQSGKIKQGKVIYTSTHQTHEEWNISWTYLP